MLKADLSNDTLLKYERLNIIPVKKPIGKKSKIYYQEGLDKAILLGYLIANIGLSTTAIRILFEVFKIFNIDLANLKTICDRIVPEEVQIHNTIKKKKLGRNF